MVNSVNQAAWRGPSDALSVRGKENLQALHSASYPAIDDRPQMRA
jgi:hypothetical protein